MARAPLFSINSNHYLLPLLQSTWIESRALHCRNCTLHLHSELCTIPKIAHCVAEMHFSGAICTATRKLSQISGNLELAQSSRNPFCREVLKLCEAFFQTFSNFLLAAWKKICENEMSTMFWSGTFCKHPGRSRNVRPLINFLDLPKIVLDPF